MDEQPTNDIAVSTVPMTEEAMSESVRALEDIVEEVRALRTSNRKLRLLLGIVAVVAVFAGASAVIAVKASRDATQARVSSDAGREEARLEACQVRNNSARETRRAIDENTTVTYNRFALLFTNLKAAFPSPRLTAFIDSELAIPPDDVTPDDKVVDSDCNFDGVVNDADYPEGTE